MKKLQQLFDGQLQEHFPLRDLTTLKIGGPAQALVIAKTQDQLIKAVKLARQENINFLVIGGGSNLLISDEGFPGLIIKNEVTGIEFANQQSHPGGGIVTVQSGTPLQELVDFTINHGLSGLQKLTGVPGTLGGAVYGNAGAYGQTISDHILNVVILGSTEHSRSATSESEDSGLTRVTLSKEECGFGYRDSNFKQNKNIILEVTFQFQLGDQKVLAKEAAEVLAQRLVRYPRGIMCPGSFFKNVLVENLSPGALAQIPPEKITFGKVGTGVLLEMVGAKGQRLGNIQVSPHHGNLFINLGDGKALDFYQLAQEYAQKVKEKFGVTLEPEVQLINLPPLFIESPDEESINQ